jgi:hypothetical protein
MTPQQLTLSSPLLKPNVFISCKLFCAQREDSPAPPQHLRSLRSIEIAPRVASNVSPDQPLGRVHQPRPHTDHHITRQHQLRQPWLPHQHNDVAGGRGRAVSSSPAGALIVLHAAFHWSTMLPTSSPNAPLFLWVHRSLHRRQRLPPRPAPLPRPHKAPRAVEPLDLTPMQLPPSTLAMKRKYWLS